MLVGEMRRNPKKRQGRAALGSPLELDTNVKYQQVKEIFFFFKCTNCNQVAKKN